MQRLWGIAPEQWWFCIETWPITLDQLVNRTASCPTGSMMKSVTRMLSSSSRSTCRCERFHIPFSDRTLSYLKIMDLRTENDGFCIKNDEFCIKNDGFCIKNDGFARASRSTSSKVQRIAIESFSFCPWSARSRERILIFYWWIVAESSFCVEESSFNSQKPQRRLRLYWTNDGFCIENEKFCIEWHRRGEADAWPGASAKVLKIAKIADPNFLLKLQKERRIAPENWWFSIQKTPITLQLEVRSICMQNHFHIFHVILGLNDVITLNGVGTSSLNSSARNRSSSSNTSKSASTCSGEYYYIIH